MSDSKPSEQTSLPSLDSGPSRPELAPRLVKAEANLLRLPLFALHTKGLKGLDGIVCRGQLNRDGVTYDFLFQVTRNTATTYPGPLARAAHLALLSLVSERGFPFQNPVTWTWRDLCRRMGIAVSGRTVERLKAAIRSTKGLLITSEDALFDKETGKQIRTERALSLYDEVVFASEMLGDGTVAQANRLSFSSWYLANLNAFYTAPLDYGLWRDLNEKSTIASRLYEFLFVNFYSGTPVLRINYENLALFLPVKPEKYLSDARRQFEGPLQILESAGVVAGVDWQESRSGLANLVFRRGPRLVASAEGERLTFDFTGEEFTEALTVEEIRNPSKPDARLVSEFYRLWSDRSIHRPTAKELAQARELIKRFGTARKALAVLQTSVRRMKARWPDARTFGAVLRYIEDGAAALEKSHQDSKRTQGDTARRQAEQEMAARAEAEREAFAAAWKPLWDSLDEPEREAIRREVTDGRPYLHNTPTMVEALCLEVLARKRASDEPD